MLLDVKSGHIVDAVNIPFISLMDPDNKTMLVADNVRKVFKNAGIDIAKPIVAMCGTGANYYSVIIFIKHFVASRLMNSICANV